MPPADSPAIAIRHEEAASFRNANRNSGDRLRFMLHHHVAAREMLLACPCTDGCPGCVGAAAGSGAKETLKRILDELLEKKP